ncbi:MAG: MBL fold metallo-hydrolase [Candidatus Dormibacteraeota bacterium]|uniref:MBL fold metallo-hydrolase n=1 Tax=Candidatus Aeolococcus gillhamiae TaxID=3127015 RepID=A0A2W5ZZJ1_9BACT|nr:MBL fold metallo-hydrolase [Candidatus Dormibacteraeota bacterium]PZR78678.1 MAG: metal-binding protein [Candidatus Dormibacter sp. RRmetagenome_bin12]
MAEAVRDLLELTVVVDPTYEQNCYVLHRRDSDAALVIDPGLQHRRTLQLLEDRGWRCERILLTHGHGDHVNGVPAVVAVHRCPVALHPDDREQLVSMRFLPGIPDDVPDVHIDEDLADSQVIGWHDLSVGVTHTPGHTRGSVCFLVGTDLLSGDTLFHRGVGRADLPGGNWQQLMVSIEERLYVLAPDTVVHPGHGQSTTIAQEMAGNPFVVHPRYR